ncbi:hypothetical protein HDU67_009320 [Dinochytrium kinnereticum]|nr:hypothetical protein HDU67_009320 [Dinochytrium kinnereticum]
MHGVLFPDAENSVRMAKPGDIDAKVTKVAEDSIYGRMVRAMHVTSHYSAVWSIDATPYAPYVLSAGADGAIRIANMYRPGERLPHNKPMRVDLYRLTKSSHDYDFELVDDVKREMLSEVIVRGEDPINFFPEEVALQRVVFNKTPAFKAWVASGGVMGMVRVECIVQNQYEEEEEEEENDDDDDE